MKRFFVTFLLISLLGGAFVTSAQDQLTGTVNNVRLNVRTAPDVDSARVGQLAPGSSVQVLGRNAAGDWLYISAPSQGVTGWAAVGFIRLDRAVRIMEAIPQTDARGTSAQVAAPNANAPDASPDGDTQAPPVATWPAEPPAERTDYPSVYLPPAVINNVRGIYARGKQRGNNAATLIKVGESNMAQTVFLCTFEWGAYDLGQYTDLQETVNRFASTGSLCRFHFTAQRGFSTASVLDPTFATDAFCQPNETPLACEVRRSNPAYAIIYIGMADHTIVPERQYEVNLTRIVQQLSGWGVVPILSTYPTSDKFTDGKPQAHNEIVREVARAQLVPLIDARATLYDFANRGTGPDGYHLSVRDPRQTTFNGDETLYGRTWLELQTLQLLRDLNNAVN